MKKIFLAIILFLAIPVQAESFNVLVLPSDLLNVKENYYNFEEASEIFTKDIIENFNLSNGKIKSPDLFTVKNRLVKNEELAKITRLAFKKYINDGYVDYELFKKIGDDFSCKYVLIVASSAVTNKNSIKRGVWEILNISTAFDISYPYRLETYAVLLDNTNNLVMWSNSYSTKLGDNDNTFEAKNFVQASSQLEKIRMYSKDIVAPSIAQNITLRFFPKSIRPIETQITEPTGGALRYEKNIPELPQKPKLREDFYGDTVFGI